MKKENWSLILSGASILISIIAICMAGYRTPNLGFDYQGVIIAILSLLVTILIGWQIYNVIYVENRVRKSMESVIKNLDEKIESRTKSAKEEAIGTSLYNLGLIMFYNKLYEFALDNFIKSIGATSKSDMEKKDAHVEQTLRAIITTIHCMEKDIDKDKYTITERTLASYSNLLIELHDERIFDIMEFVKKLKRRPG